MTGNEGATAWETLGRVPPHALADARLEVHWAAQLVASFGQALVEPRADDSHRAMTWRADLRAFLGEPAATEPPLRASLRPSGLQLSVRGHAMGTVASTALVGRTLTAGYEWLAAAAGAAVGRSAVELAPPEYEIPDHPVGRGDAFPAATGGAVDELARWFANAYGVLDEIAGRAEGASPVRVWPHHFDIATLISLDPGGDPETARSVGVGLSPGDDDVPEPYWYVNAWPYPDVRRDRLPPLPGGGAWNPEGWFGATLRGTAAIEPPTARGQQARAEGFVEAAVRVCRELLNG